MKILDSVDNIPNEGFNKMIDEIIAETTLEENYNKQLLNKNYKKCFNAIIFNGYHWNSEQNLYSGLKEFQEIDKLVYLIVKYSLSYLNKVKNVNCNECYLEYDGHLYFLEHIEEQGSFSRITLENFENYNSYYYIDFEEVLKWINTTDDWRMFEKIS